jgi:hypothetical protein
VCPEPSLSLTARNWTCGGATYNEGVFVSTPHACATPTVIPLRAWRWAAVCAAYPRYRVRPSTGRVRRMRAVSLREFLLQHSYSNNSK